MEIKLNNKYIQCKRRQKKRTKRNKKQSVNGRSTPNNINNYIKIKEIVKLGEKRHKYHTLGEIHFKNKDADNFKVKRQKIYTMHTLINRRKKEIIDTKRIVKQEYRYG